MRFPSLGRTATVVACTGLLILGVDYAALASTGQSLLLGKVNTAGTTTKVTNTGAGPTLNLQVKSSSTAPLSTNGKGKVANLYADRAASADNSTKLGGRTLAQVRSGVDASLLQGQTADEVANLGMTWGRVNGSDNTYSSAGDVTVTHAGTGLYCIYVSGISSSGGQIVGSADYATDDTHIGEAQIQTYVEVDSSGSDCSADGFEIVTFNSTPASPYSGTEQQTYFADTGFTFTVVGFPASSARRAASPLTKSMASRPPAHSSSKP